MENERVREIKREDKKAFKSFAVMMILCLLGGAVFGFVSSYIGDNFSSNISNLTEVVKNIFVAITPFANLVISIITIIISEIVYKKCRAEYKLWSKTGEDEEQIDNIEKKLSCIVIFTGVNIILGFFFFGLGGILLPFSKASGALSPLKVYCFGGGFVLSFVCNFLIQKEIVNFEKEINPLLKGSVYDSKFTKTFMDSCDEAAKLGIYKSAYKAYTHVSFTCVILWLVSVIGSYFWDFGAMPLIMITIIWLVQVISYGIESMKY